MKEIIIRTNFNIKVGLGHFFRCKILKEKFERKNFKVTFIIDNITKSKLTKNINILNLNQKRFNYLEDSKLVYEKIKNRDVCLILVDDYRIDFRWEKIFVKKGYKVAIIDDLANRKHYCDFLIDSGWYGKKENIERYSKLIKKNTITLYGPQYKILSPKIKRIKKKEFNIMFYFGGGNYLNSYYEIINDLVTKLKLFRIKVKVNIVVSGLFNLNKKINNKNKHVNIIKNNYELSKIINGTSLYIGSNSSIVNDLSYLKTPRILISVNKLQNINIKNYQDLGNYIYIKHPFTQSLNKITNLIIEVVNNFTRFKNLFLNPKIKIDKNGADRIVKILIKKIDD